MIKILNSDFAQAKKSQREGSRASCLCKLKQHWCPKEESQEEKPHAIHAEDNSAEKVWVPDLDCAADTQLLNPPHPH